MAVSPSVVSVTAVVVVAVLAAVEAHPPGTDHGIMSIKNNLPYPMSILCSSDVERKTPFYALPGANLQFDFDIHVHFSWACSFQSEGPDGTFVLWNSQAAGGPGRLCLEVCQWRADDDGLKVLRNASGKTVLIYGWH